MLVIICIYTGSLDQQEQLDFDHEMNANHLSIRQNKNDARYMFLNADLFLQYRSEFRLIDESFDPSVDIDIRLLEVLENEKKTF